MQDDSRAWTVVLAGAAIGGLAGFLFFTERGRALRRQFEPALEDFARELVAFRSTIQRAVGVATESWDAVSGGTGGPNTPNVH